MAILLLRACGLLAMCTNGGVVAHAAVTPVVAGALADSGTAAPSDSGTEAPPQEDEPPAGSDQPSEKPQDDEAPADGFGCPVHEPGPYPLLI